MVKVREPDCCSIQIKSAMLLVNSVLSQQGGWSLLIEFVGLLVNLNKVSNFVLLLINAN